ncbi:hypothetical protein [Bradyrhizobium tunisiense]|uniref:hypothetical protein n=1 Tax=Bradyrhizobium tunisiense TaxID=3278709 RepID=UPI0035DC5903
MPAYKRFDVRMSRPGMALDRYPIRSPAAMQKRYYRHHIKGIADPKLESIERTEKISAGVAAPPSCIRITSARLVVIATAYAGSLQIPPARLSS